MAPLRFGICGCGGISNLHAACLKQLEAIGLAKLVAGAEPVAGRASTWSAKWSVPVYSTLEEMLATAVVDVVTITSPSGMHAAHVIQAANAGKHVLCEKPLDLQLARADAAIDAAKTNGVVLGGIFQQRFAPGPLKAKAAIADGLFGKIIFAHCETPWYRDQSYYDQDDWRGTWDLDGGVLANQSPHMIDRLIWLAGDVVEVMHAELRCGFERKIEAETVAAVTLRLEGGTIATLTGTTLAYDGMPQRVLICGTNGSCAFAGDDLISLQVRDTAALSAWQHDSQEASRSAGAADPMSIGPDCHLNNIQDFALAIRDRRAPAVTAQDARRVVRALNLIYAKAGIVQFAK